MGPCIFGLTSGGGARDEEGIFGGIPGNDGGELSGSGGGISTEISEMAMVVSGSVGT
jgi:hypothetical protein